MLRKIVNVLVILPLAIIFIVFAVANRHVVTLSFDPFDSKDAALGISLPLFVVIIAAAIFGVIAGGVATWIGQHRWRRAARRHETEARAALAQLADLRSQSRGLGQGGEASVSPSIQPGGFPAIQGPQYGSIGRDKPGVTL